MRKLIIASIISLLCACGGSSNNPPPNTPDHRTDLPAGWQEVKGEGYSFGLPPDFQPTRNEYVSSQRHLTVNFGQEKTSIAALEQFLLTIVIPRLHLSDEIIDLRQNKKTGTYAILSFQPNAQNKLQDTIKLSFYRAVDKSPTNEAETKLVSELSCRGERATFKQSAQICFDIVDTLELQ